MSSFVVIFFINALKYMIYLVFTSERRALAAISSHGT